jgi:hypothetical protein
MFVELMPLVTGCTVLITVAKVGDKVTSCSAVEAIERHEPFVNSTLA